MANVQDYELLLKVRADLQQALSGMKGLATSIGGVKAEADAAGESADQAADRIRKMVQASGQQATVQESVRSQNERAAQAAKASAVDYDAQAAAIKRAADATTAYRERLAATSAQPGKSSVITAQRQELAQLVGQIDPTVAALGRLDAQEAKLNQLRKAGVVGVEDYQKYSAAINESRIALTSASGAVHKFSLNNATARREIGYITKDLAIGNYGRLSQSALTLASNTGLVAKAFSLAGLGIGVTVAALALVSKAFLDGQEQSAALRNDIILTGNSAGVTAGQLEGMVQRIGANSGSYSDARKVINTLAASGKIAGEDLQRAGQAAIDMATVTGISVDKAVQEIIKLGEDPVAQIKKLNDEYHFLTAAQYEQIKALQDEGKERQAAGLAEQIYADQMHQRAQEVTDNAGTLERAGHAVARAWDEAWNQISGIGRTPQINAQIAQLEDRLKSLQNPTVISSSNPVALARGTDPSAQAFSKSDRAAQIAVVQAQIQALRLAQAKAGLAATQAQDAAQANQDAIAARDRLAAFASAGDKRDKAIKQAGIDRARALYGVVDDADRAKIEAEYTQEVKQANDAFDRSIKKPRKPRSTAGQEKAAAAAQEELIKLLGDEQGALDPVAKIWATYNDEVTKANALAAKAKTAKGANVAAIDAERDAVIGLYATARDKSLAAFADKDRQAWEQLRKSLLTPLESKTETAEAQIKELNAALKQGIINAQQYHDGLKRVGEGSVTPLPQYKGLDAAVGGVGSELGKNFQAAKALQDSYDAQLKAADAHRHDDLAHEEAYLAAKAKLDDDYNKQKAVIDQSRNQLTLDTASDLFGQLATLQSSHNKTEARIGKAAAIAQTIIKTYQSATEAYASLAGIPYVGPALGAAAAAIAIAAGLANVQAIRAQPVGGYAEGGYTGPGAKNQPAGVVHAGEVVWSQDDISRAGGVSVVESWRRGLPGYADGGYVNPLVGVLVPDGIAAAAASAQVGTRNLPRIAAAGAKTPQVNVKTVLVQSADQLAEEILNTPTGTKLVIQHVGDNPNKIRSRWGG